MKTFLDVQDEYAQYKSLGGTKDLASFAQYMDSKDGAPLRQSAYNPTWYKKADALIDRGFRATKIPEATAGAGRLVGEGFDALTGTSIAPVVEQVGRDVPRMVTEGLLTLPMAGSVAGAPAAGAMWANRARRLAQIAGYGSAALRGGAQTESGLGALVSAGALGAGNVLIPKAGRATQRAVTDFLERGVPNVTPEVASAVNAGTAQGVIAPASAAVKVAGPVANVAGGTAAATGINEATRQLMLSVGPNAVGITSPERNPLTPENIAGNVAGAAFFLPQLVTGLRRPQQGSPKQERQMFEHLQRLENEQKVETGQVKPEDVPVIPKTEAPLPPPVDARTKTMFEGFRSAVEIAKQRRATGKLDEAQRFEELALDHYNEFITGKPAEIPDDMVRELQKTVTDAALFQTGNDGSPEWLAKFVGDVRNLIDSMGDARETFETEKAAREATLDPSKPQSVKAFNEFVASWEKNKGVSWHPDAKSGVLIDQLWKSGDLPPLTVDWLKNEFNAGFDASGNPQFAYRTVLQKVANYFIERTDAALAKRATRKVEVASTEAEDVRTTKARQKYQDLDYRFVQAFEKFPEDVQKALALRSRDVFRYGNLPPEVAENVGAAQGQRYDARLGKFVQAYTSWQRAVIRAAESYMPESNSVMVQTGKNQFRRVPVETLFNKDADGKPLWKPVEGSVPVAHGGKRSETNIEDLATQRAQESVGAEDEVAFRQAMDAEQSRMGVRGEGMSETDLALLAEQDKRGGVEPDLERMSTEDFGTGGKPLPVESKKIFDTLDSLSDEQLWRLAGDVFPPERYSQNAERRRTQLKRMVRVAVENYQSKHLSPEGAKFLAESRAAGIGNVAGRSDKFNLDVLVRNFFRSETPFAGAKGTRPFAEERVLEIVRRLVDPKAVETVRKELEPKMQVSTDRPSDFVGDLTEPPAPGKFSEDVTKSYTAWVEKYLARAGYSGSSRKFITEVAASLTKAMMSTNKMDFYRLIGREFGVAWDQGAKGQPDRPSIGVKMNEGFAKGDEAKVAVGLLQTLAHELSHMDDYIRLGAIPQPDAYSDERRRVSDNFHRLAAALSPEERASMREMVREAFPPHLRRYFSEKGSKDPLGTSNVEEFVAEMNADLAMILAADTADGKKFVEETLKYAPQELREFSRNTVMTIKDVLEAMRFAVENPEARVNAGESVPTARGQDPFVLTKTFEVVLENARLLSGLDDAEQSLAIGRSLVASLTPKGMQTPPPEMTRAVWYRGDKELNEFQKVKAQTSDTSAETLEEVGKTFSMRTGDQSKKLSRFTSWVWPFANQMENLARQGVTLGRDVLDTVMSLEPGTSRIYSSLMGGFLKKNADGSYDINADHPLVRKVSEDPNGRWRKGGVDRVSDWQNKNKGQTMFVKDKDGRVTVNTAAEGAERAWEVIRSQLSREDQDLVMNASVALDEANQLAAQHLIAHAAQSNTNLVATYLLSANKRMTYDQAKVLAAKVMSGYLSGNVLSLRGTIPDSQLAALDRLLVGTVNPETKIGDGLVPKFLEVRQKLESRPGFRTESLPHDWIVKYKDKGETRYASAPLENQALALAERLRRDGKQIVGEVVHRNDLREVSDFDAPDAIIQKLAETERFAYEKFVNEMEQQYGANVADTLREGYSPAVQALKELGRSSLDKFTRQRKGLVDVKEYDYIDGTLGYLGRLSHAIAIRSVEQNLRLILHDPRARVLPSFRKLVQEHFQEMIQPTSDFHKQAKAFTTTYFLGANLGSSAVNLTQSGVTLVPWLIAGNTKNTSVGHAYGQLFSAVGDAVGVTVGKGWQAQALAAEGKSPTAWSLDDATAAMYKRHVEAGGISRTVVDDLVYGRDQRMLMNAKFGHGNYGPVPLGKMAGDKLYVASQMMMNLYKWSEHFNAKTAFFAGVRQGYENGLRGDPLYAHAVRVQTLATFGGGRANAPGIAGARFLRPGPTETRSAVGLVNALQQYGYGMVATFGQLGKDALGASAGLSAIERRQAQKAFGTMLMTQTAIAGVLGLPFAGAALTLLEKIFGIPATQAVREGLASLGGDDDETGAAIAETALNGFPNQLAGLDLSSRLGTSNLLGTSSYRGFDLKDMVGPAGSIVGNAVDALNLFGQGKPMQAARELVPAAFKNVVEMSDMRAKYGTDGMRDAAGNLLYTPTPRQSYAYTLGFRPRELSQKRQMQSLTSRANERTQVRRDSVLDGAAQRLLQGDPTVAQRLAQEAFYTDRTVDPTEILRSVMDRSVGMVSEKDLLAQGSRWNEQERMDIAKTFGPEVNPRQSETEIQKLRLQFARMLGNPRLAPTMESFRQAAMVDMLVKQRGMPKSQAIRLAEWLSP